jgi:ATP-dependent helicase/nuclease subunit A
MAVPFSDEQLRAIEARGAWLFLHAGAGSGKTAVLVERFVRSLTDDEIPVERMLAITFTEKAATELRIRVRRELVERGQHELARAAESAWISTIHGFCARLLRAHSLTAGLDPEFRVLDEAEGARLRLDAFDRALEAFLEEQADRGRLDLLASYTPDKLGEMTRAAYTTLRTRGERQPCLPAVPAPAVGPEPSSLDSAAAAAAEALAGGRGQAVEEALGRLGRCREALRDLAPTEIGDHELFDQLRIKQGKAKALQVAAVTDYGEALDAYIALCRAQRGYADYLLVSELLRHYGREYALLKERRSALDFEDLELVARDLLAGHRGLRELYRRRFARVMVDEFQDTNRLQCELLDLLAPDDRSSLFTVGDELQSIYGFRGADVEVFRERRQQAEAAGSSGRLALNHRSDPALIDALDLAWTDAFDGRFEPLVAAPGRTGGAGRPAVELLVVDADRRRWEEALGEDAFRLGRTLPPWRAAEARLLAKRVEEVAAENELGWGEIAVLVRAATDLPAYERALAERGIPTYAAGGGGYWEQQQVADVRAYLAALANPLDELALCSVLASPLVGVSLDTIALLRVKGGKRDLWSVLEAAFLAGADRPAELLASLAEQERARLESFARRFARERRTAARFSLETLIDRALTSSGYDLAVLALPAGDRRMANLRKLMRLAREYESDEGRDLRGFIDFLGERDVLGDREPEAPLQVEHVRAVRMMTIHAAKGLEFPAVFVADLGREGRTDDSALRVSEDGRVGIQLASMAGGSAKAMQFEALAEDRLRRGEEEERRVFYVAMTRAQRHLVLSGATDVERWPAPRQLGVPMAWIWRAFAPELEELTRDGPEHVVQRVYEGRTVSIRCLVCRPADVARVLPPEDRAPAERRLAPEQGNGRPAAPPPQPIEPAGPPAVRRLSYSGLAAYERCSYRFYLERVLRLPAPARGTGPADDAPPAPVGPPPPEAADAPGGDELPALLRGTIVHELLERVDFAAHSGLDAHEVRAAIAAQGGPATQETVADVGRLIDAFLASALCARLAAAQRVRRELPFVFSIEPNGHTGAGVLVNGVVDVHAQEELGCLIVDYKSDALDGATPAEACERKYAGQRLVYALAALRDGARRVEVVYCFLERPDEPVSQTYGTSDRERLERELVELAGGMLAGRFSPTDAPHRELCASCPGQPALCSWEPAQTLADEPPPPGAGLLARGEV